MIVIGAGNMLIMYMAIEMQAISIYVMIGQRGELKGIEGAIKYYIIGGISTGLIIYGSSMIYKATGEMSIRGMTGITIGGVGKGMITMGLLIKMSAAPMHMWAPDVYEGATMGGIAMIGTIGKISIVGAIIHIGGIGNVIMMSSILSIIYGGIGAMNQSKIKRLLGYSGIGHMGYILMGISIGTYEGIEGGLIYIVIYMGMMVGIITMMNIGGMTEMKDYIGK